MFPGSCSLFHSNPGPTRQSRLIRIRVLHSILSRNGKRLEERFFLRFPGEINPVFLIFIKVNVKRIIDKIKPDYILRSFEIWKKSGLSNLIVCASDVFFQHEPVVPGCTDIRIIIIPDYF